MPDPQEQTAEAGEAHSGGAVVPGSAAHQPRRRQRVLRVRITDVDTGRLKVGLSLPAGLVPVALRQGARLMPRVPNGPNLASLIDGNSLREPLVVDDEQNGERVEISLE